VRGGWTLTATSVRDRVVDVKGTCCPYPQLKTKVALDQMRPGEVLRVLTDDRATADNIRIAVEQLEDAVLGIEEKEGIFTIVIQKSQRSYKSALRMKLSK